MKKYKNNSDTIHAFAQQNQASGKNPNGTLFFEYKKLYSYGYHFCLAEFLTDNIILLNDSRYSNTTNKHQSETRFATSQYIQLKSSTYYIENVNMTLRDLKKSLEKAKKPEIYLNRAFQIIEEHERANQIHPNVENYSYLKEKPIFDELKEFFLTVKNSDKLKAYRQKQAEKDAKIKAEYIKAFNNYEPFEALRNKLSKKFDLIRLSECGKLLETSQNVKIPVSDALAYYKDLKSGKIQAGYEIGSFTVSNISNSYIQIGCHNFTFADIEKTFNKLNQR
jgi:hypothetical protein